MQIIAYQYNLQEEWDDFVMKSKNGNLMHTQKFLSYHDEGKWSDKSILIYSENELIALFPACEVSNKIISHGGATYGGVIVKRENKLEFSLKIIKSIINHYSSFDEIIYKNQEYIFDKYPSDEIHFAAIRNGFEAKYFELSTAIKLSDYQVSVNRLEKINRASKKIIIKENDSNYEDFYPILVKNLKDKHNVNPTHSFDEILKLKGLFPDKFILFGAYADEKLIGGIWLVKLTNKTYHTFYITQDYEFKQLYTSSLLLSIVIEYAKNEECEYLNFGVSTEEKGEVINEGLYKFKETFGGFGINRITYSKKL